MYMGNPSVLYELVINLENKSWGISCPLDQSLIGPVQYGWDRYKKDPKSMTYGGGLLAGSPLPGTRRMVFCGYSPAWEGFYVSSMGGAMHVFHRVGVNYVWIRGQAAQDVIMIINHKGGEYTVRFEPIQPEDYWNEYKDENGRVWEGFYGLQTYLFENYRDVFGDDWFRILTVGPGARNTVFGAIGSNQIRKGKRSHIDDWAGRGGLGSQLLQHHKIAGIVFGGDWQDPALKESKELDQYFLDHFGQRTMLADIALSQKYRFVPKFETGGTFGVNMHESEDRLFSFNYSSIYESDDLRLMQHDQFIVKHYLRQFNEEIIAPRNFDHCGEPCAVVCKKYLDEYKKDYEPYQAMGPNCGIFDQRAAEKLNKYADSLGVDAIQAGGIISWIMELAYEKLIPAEQFGLPVEPPRFKFVSQPDEFDIVVDSEFNAEYAINVLKMVVFSSQGAPFRANIRFAAKWLDQLYGIKSIDRAVYNAHGKNGCMVPNQYWVPGMFAPMPLMGKYFSYYGIEHLPPYEIGRKSVERFVFELYSENSGSCRFHRKWVEDIIDEIILSHFDLKFDYWRTNFTLANEITMRQEEKNILWENERTIDIVQGFLERWQRIGLNDEGLKQWIKRFENDKWNAAKDYWDEMVRGIQDAFAENIPKPPHADHGFIQGRVK
jgi:glyceraldehyde-3-phosphate dehydrogenase (ferredoxin)